MVSGLAQCVQVGIWKMQIHDFYILFQNVFMLIIYIKMLLDCDWLISVQLISNSAKIYNSSAKTVTNRSDWWKKQWDLKSTSQLKAVVK